MKSPLSSIINPNTSSVKSNLNTVLSSSPDSMIHHKYSLPPGKVIVSYDSIRSRNTYGVSRSRRILSPELFLKKYDYIRDCLMYTLELTSAQREVVLRLLRYWAYYGQVYTKESTVTEDPGCSKATFWRTLRLLKELGLIQVINRYVVRPHAQISNLYRLDRLLLLLARYLAEHGVRFLEKWLKPYLSMPGHSFWSTLRVRNTDGVPMLKSYLINPGTIK